MRLNIDDVELCVETFGAPSDPALLLVMGAEGSMDRWEEPFCERLAAAGRHVIRYDNRDTGGSTCYPPGRPGYSADDLVSDALAILDALAIERAHLVGMSMGGALVQRIAVEHPERVLSIALLSTSPAGPGGDALPPMSDDLAAAFAEQAGWPEPDWGDRAAVIEYLLAVERPYAGPRGLDEDAHRALLGRVYDRSPGLASARNHGLLGGSVLPRARLGEIAVPALVIHGTDDPLFRPAHGAALARAIPGADLLLVDGLGHELPPWAWDAVVPALVALTARSS
jgi:pimeloyl-ACP methyl ester carboxylesterase